MQNLKLGCHEQNQSLHLLFVLIEGADCARVAPLLAVYFSRRLAKWTYLPQCFARRRAAAAFTFSTDKT
jgi:hypothetical protein